MLTLTGPGHRYCDGGSRRSFLKIGGLALGGATAGLHRACSAPRRAEAVPTSP